MLKVSNINVYYGQIHALRGVCLAIEAGQIVSIIGANGAGKSTLMMTLAGVLRPKSGEILFEDVALPAQPHNVVARGISLVPERRRLYPNLTVKENLLMGAFVRKDKHGVLEDLDRMHQLFPIMKQRTKQYAGTLSGGEQQMVAIARGLMSRPKLLLLDEPSLGLAPMIAEGVFQTLKDIQKLGTTVFLAEQNAFRSLEIADKAFVMESGQIILSGPGRDLLGNEAVQAAYLGVRH